MTDISYLVRDTSVHNHVTMAIPIFTLNINNMPRAREIKPANVLYPLNH